VTDSPLFNWSKTAPISPAAGFGAGGPLAAARSCDGGGGGGGGGGPPLEAAAGLGAGDAFICWRPSVTDTPSGFHWTPLG
jgi:hypothetical protein